MSRHIVIEGNLTRDPNGGYGKDSGKAYTHLDVAVTDRTKNTNANGSTDPPPTTASPSSATPPRTHSTAGPTCGGGRKQSPFGMAGPNDFESRRAAILARGAKSP
jgi:hypothetical protein